MSSVNPMRIFDPNQGGRTYEEGGEAPGEPRMSAAYTLSEVLVREKFEQERPLQVGIWKGIRPEQILVMDGQYDQIHLVLEAAKMAHTRLVPDELNPDLLTQARVVFVNCNGWFPADRARLLAPFVEAGGLVMTTDWALKDVVEVAFPGFVRKGQRQTGNDFVPVTPQLLEDPLVKAFFEAQGNPGWWLERSSYSIARFPNAMERGLQVLVDSERLRQMVGHGSVIVRFPFGKGGVYHLISHLYLQQHRKVQGAAAGTSVAFATAMGGSAQTIGTYKAAEEQWGGELDAGVAQSAAASLSFVTGTVLGHLEKGRSTKDPADKTTDPQGGAVDLDEKGPDTKDPKKGGGGGGGSPGGSHRYYRRAPASGHEAGIRGLGRTPVRFRLARMM